MHTTTAAIMRITQLYFYHEDARKMQLANFLNTYGYAAILSK